MQSPHSEITAHVDRRGMATVLFLLSATGLMSAHALTRPPHAVTTRWSGKARGSHIALQEADEAVEAEAEAAPQWVQGNLASGEPFWVQRWHSNSRCSALCTLHRATSPLTAAVVVRER